MNNKALARNAAAFVQEALIFLAPVIEIGENIDGPQDLANNLRKYLAEFGYDPTAAEIAALKNDFAAMDPSISDTVSGVLSGDADFLPALGSLMAQLKSLDGLPAIAGIVDDPLAFFDEIFDRLAFRYLTLRAPISQSLLAAAGVLEQRTVLSEDPDGRDLDYLSIRLNWPVLGLLFRDIERWAYQVYGWDENPDSPPHKGFDHHKAMTNLANIIRATQLAMVYEEKLTPGDKSRFLQNAGNRDFFRQNLPVFQSHYAGVNADDVPQFENEAGLAVLPSGNVNLGHEMGLAFSPYVKGTVAADIPVSPFLSLGLEVGAQVTGGAYVTVMPAGLGVETSAAVDTHFEISATYEHPLGHSIYLVGDETSTNISITGVHATVGGTISSAGGAALDFFAAGGPKGLGAAIDVGEDGLLAAVIPEPIRIEIGDMLLGWRSGRGVYFEGGTSLSVTVPMDVPIGPVTLYEVGLGLDWAEDFRAELTITADLTLGPVYAYAEGIGLSGTVTTPPDGDGMIGKYDLAFGFIPPTGYAVALNAEVLSGGGLLSVGEDEYRGALSLQIANFGISAFAILNTRLPGGENGFSLGASIFADINVPLAYGFFLTGVGGMLGINRTVDSDALRDVLFEGRLDNLLFPSDPIENAKTILDDMAAVMPPIEGQHLFGPAARISWGVPQIIDIKLGVVLEVGSELRLLILGGMGVNLPDRDIAIVAINLSFMGEIDFAAGTISFDATLENSRVLAMTISGDTAIRTGWGTGITHIASFGGLHPKYPRPANLPELRRLSIAFGTNNPSITLSAYHAIAMNAVMFGARADLYAKGPKIKFVGQVAAMGFVAFDALIYFDPFAFDVRLAGGLDLLVDGKSRAELGFSLDLTGPNTFRISGNVWVKVFGIKVEFGITHTWGSPQSIPAPSVNAVDELRRALENGAGAEPIAAGGMLGGVTFAESEGDLSLLDPAGGVRIAQGKLPLGIAIQKIGEASVSGPRTLDFRVFIQSQQQHLDDTDGEFVRSQYFRTSEDEKLRLPSFETHKAGYEFAPDQLETSAGDMIREDYAYEVIQIEEMRETPELARIFKRLPLSASLAGRMTRTTYGTALRPSGALGSLVTPGEGNVSVARTRYVSENAISGQASALGERTARTGIASVVEMMASSKLTAASLSEVSVVAEVSTTVANDKVADYIAAARLKDAM